MKNKNDINTTKVDNSDLDMHKLEKNASEKIHTFKHGVALNVTRTRVTVLVFNLSIISFMLSMLKSSTGLAHLSTSIALFLGFCLTLLGLWLLLYSQTWDKLGLSRPWPFVLGSMTTYLALSQTVTAFIHEYLLGLKSVFKTIPTGMVDPHDFMVLNNTVVLILFTMAALIWFLITYIAPMSIFLRHKNPVTIGRRWILALYYLSIQIPIFWIYTITWRLEYTTTEQQLTMAELFALQFIQPVLWWSH